MSENRKKSKFGKLLYRAFLDALAIVCLIVALFSGYMLFTEKKTAKEGNEVYDKVREHVNVKPAAEKGEEEEEWVLDFDYLKGVNADTIAWIYLEDSAINYPIVYSGENEYYLDHTFDGAYNPYGTIFVDEENHNPFHDVNTVLYGHNMHDGAMFHDIEKYRDPSYYTSHRIIHIYTPDEEFEVYPIAGVMTDGSTEYVRLYFGGEDEFVSYIRWFTQHSTFESRERLEYGDRMVLFSTCAYDYDDARYVLIGKLVEKKTEE